MNEGASLGLRDDWTAQETLNEDALDYNEL